MRHPGRLADKVAKCANNGRSCAKPMMTDGKYLEEGELTKKKSSKVFVARSLANEIVPVLGGSAFKNKGVQAMLDAVIEYLPSPTK